MQEEERRSVEASGRTVDEAIEKALEDLGADADQVETEILTEGSRGLLGLGGEEARVRVTVVEPEEPEEPVSTGEEVAEIGRDVVRELLRHMGVEAEVVVQESDQVDVAPMVLDVTGDNLGILIGRQGETLRDLQYIVRLIVSRKLQRWANIVVDVGGYKRRRERILTELAGRMAERVVAEGRPVTLEPMPAHERRIVHIALRDHDLVRTESTGEGRRRKVVIFPNEYS
ncbi:MAG: KH domain-containing protein [Anaerolineae bacterium]|nr:KH domain-containing protein [Anaerolineae bacterium]NIN96001.1 KH domain-containing protein [Anaerolineae bacterium]NIQ79033.1 KH domain-containing protein [Anaerolineae bacterium]